MDSSKSIDTPISIATKLNLDEEGKSVEQKLYRGMIGHCCIHCKQTRYCIQCFHVDRKRPSGTTHFLGSYLVSWETKKHNSVALSSADYVEATCCCAQLLWIRQQLRDYDTLPPTNDKLQVEELTVEKSAGNLEKEVDTTTVVPLVEREGSKEPVQKETSGGLSFSWTEDKDDNGGKKEEGVMGSHEKHTTQDISNEEKKKKNSEEEGNSESEGEDQEKAYVAPLDALPPTSYKPQVEELTVEKSAGNLEKEVDTTTVVPVVERKGKDEDDNGGEKEGVMGSHEEHTTQDISNEEEKKEEKNSEEEGNSESEGEDQEKACESKGVDGERKKPRKTHVKEIKSTLPTRKEVAPPARTHLTRSKEKDDDEQIIKESRGAKKPRKHISVVEPVVELDGEDESKSALPEKPSTQNRKVAKATKTVSPSARASRGKN
ncbi:uncharacterized protein [Nicotiana tomentosiformis]|uniref:uncharacterized protein n=1 Tax=Nicotiana tomentosiformis TaxID=4098 RepID=UPI00388CCE71